MEIHVIETNCTVGYTEPKVGLVYGKENTHFARRQIIMSKSNKLHELTGVWLVRNSSTYAPMINCTSSIFPTSHVSKKNLFTSLRLKLVKGFDEPAT